MSCEVLINGKNYQVKAKNFKEVYEELLKQGILEEGKDLRIQRLDVFIPEINKTITMVAKFRPDWAPHGEILQSTTHLTEEEVDTIIKAGYKFFHVIIEEEKEEYVI